MEEEDDGSNKAKTRPKRPRFSLAPGCLPPSQIQQNPGDDFDRLAAHCSRFDPSTHLVRDWLDVVEDLAEEFGWTASRTLQLAVRRLGPTAKAWYNAWKHIYPICTWSDFCDAMRERWGVSDQELHYQLASCAQQRGETVREYADRYLSLVTQLRLNYDGNLTHMYNFLRGLDPGLYDEVYTMEPGNLTTAIQKAVYASERARYHCAGRHAHPRGGGQPPPGYLSPDYYEQADEWRQPLRGYDHWDGQDAQDCRYTKQRLPRTGYYGPSRRACTSPSDSDYEANSVQEPPRSLQRIPEAWKTLERPRESACVAQTSPATGRRVTTRPNLRAMKGPARSLLSRFYAECATSPPQPTSPCLHEEAADSSRDAAVGYAPAAAFQPLVQEPSPAAKASEDPAPKQTSSSVPAVQGLEKAPSLSPPATPERDNCEDQQGRAEQVAVQAECSLPSVGLGSSPSRGSGAPGLAAPEPLVAGVTRQDSDGKEWLAVSAAAEEPPPSPPPQQDAEEASLAASKPTALCPLRVLTCLLEGKPVHTASCTSNGPPSIRIRPRPAPAPPWAIRLGRRSSIPTDGVAHSGTPNVAARQLVLFLPRSSRAPPWHSGLRRGRGDGRLDVITDSSGAFVKGANAVFTLAVVVGGCGQEEIVATEQCFGRWALVPTWALEK